MKDVEITVTCYEDVRETQGICAATTWEKIIVTLSRVNETQCQPCKGSNCKKKFGSAWSPHRIKGPRSITNVLGVTMAVFDLDDLDREEVIDVIVNLESEDYEYLLHSTHNHCRVESEQIVNGKKTKVFQGYESQDDGALPLCATQNRLRLVMPMTREVTAKEWERLWPAAKAFLGLHPDATCKDASRLYFTPTVPVGVRPVVRRGVGKPLDVDLVLAAAPRPVQMPAAAPKRVMPVYDDFDALDVAEESSKEDADEDEMSMPALRKRLVKLQRKKARSVEEKDAELYQIIKAIVAGKKFAEIGEFSGETVLPKGRSAAINKASSLLAFAFPLGTAWEVAIEFMQPCIADMDCEPEGLDSWLAVAEESYNRALNRAFEQDRKNREMREMTRESFAQAAALLPSTAPVRAPPSTVLPSTVLPSAVTPSAVIPSAVIPSAVLPSAVLPSAVLPSAVYTNTSTPSNPPSAIPSTPSPASPLSPPPTTPEGAVSMLELFNSLPSTPPSPNVSGDGDVSGGGGDSGGGGSWGDGTGDGWQNKLVRKGDKTLKSNGHNYYLILKNHTLTRDAFHLNTVTKEIEVWRGEFKDVKQGILITTLTHWLQSTGRVSPEGEGEVRSALIRLATEQSFNPVLNYLDRLVWDGVPRLDNFLFEYIKARTRNRAGADISGYLRCISPKMLIAAIARIRSPGCQVDTMPVMEGIKEGEGKSSAIRILFGEWGTETHLTIGDKDSMMILASSWGVELPELASVKRSDGDALKSYLTTKKDKYRPPYGGDILTVPRICVFWGTTNEEDWLTYDKGRRRYWPFYVVSIDLEALIRDRDQLWAEADVRYKAGERWWLDKEERKAQDIEAEARIAMTFIEEQIDEWWYKQTPVKRPAFVTFAMVVEGIKIPVERVTKALQIEIGNAMTKRLGFNKDVLTRGTRRSYGWAATPELLEWKESKQKETPYTRLVSGTIDTPGKTGKGSKS